MGGSPAGTIRFGFGPRGWSFVSGSGDASHVRRRADMKYVHSELLRDKHVMDTKS